MIYLPVWNLKKGQLEVKEQEPEKEQTFEELVDNAKWQGAVDRAEKFFNEGVKE